MKKIAFGVSLLMLLVLVSCSKTNTQTQATRGRNISPAGESASPTPYLIPTTVPPTSIPSTQAPSSATPTNSPPTTMRAALSRLKQALSRHDAVALSRLMLQQVKILGCCIDGGGQYIEASQIANVLTENTGDLKCWSYDVGEGGQSLVLVGFQLPNQDDVPHLGPDTTAIEFLFASRSPYWITGLEPLPNNLTQFGFPPGCESPADQIFPVAEQPSGANTLSGDCWNAPSPRLKVGEYAYVSMTPPTPNRIRSQPSRDGKVLGWAQPGRSMKVLDGPVCSDGWAWWRVELVNSNTTGWTAEGDGNEYWLVPCHTLADCP